MRPPDGPDGPGNGRKIGRTGFIPNADRVFLRARPTKSRRPGKQTPRMPGTQPGDIAAPVNFSGQCHSPGRTKVAGEASGTFFPSYQTDQASRPYPRPRSSNDETDAPSTFRPR